MITVDHHTRLMPFYCFLILNDHYFTITKWDANGILYFETKPGVKPEIHKFKLHIRENNALDVTRFDEKGKPAEHNEIEIFNQFKGFLRKTTKLI